MIVYTWKDGKQKNRIFNEFVKDNKFWYQVIVKNKILEIFFVQKLI